MTIDGLSPREAAVAIVSLLQQQGAVFTLGGDGYFRVDLNPVKDMNQSKANLRCSCSATFRAAT